MARRESALLWGYSGWRMCYSVVCVKMCGKCWLTHRCCRHMETQQIRLEGCPGSLLSPHRYLPPGGTWAGNRSSSQGCPGCPCLLTSEPESEQRIGDNWVSLSDSSQSSGSLWVLCQVYLWKGARRTESTDRPNQTISLPFSPDPEVCNVSLKNVQSYSLFQSYNNISVQMLKWLAKWTANVRLFTFLHASSNHR